MAEITKLPEEVLRIIFKKLDGKSLFRVARVCKFWHRIVYELRLNVKMWSTFCLTEIPMPLLADMTGLVDINDRFLILAGFTTKKDIGDPKIETSRTRTQSPGNENGMFSLLDDNTINIKMDSLVSSRLPWQFWREVYLAYRRTVLISRWPCLRRTVTESSRYGKTTCVKFHGNFLLTGHENGAVFCWVNAGTKLQTYTFLHMHLSTVTALTVIDDSNLKNGKSNIFTVISGSDDRDLHVTMYQSKPLRSACYNQSTAITSISSWGQYFVTGSQESIVHGQWVFHLSSYLKLERHYHLLGHSCSYVRCTAIWENKVVTGDNDGNIYIWELTRTDKPYLLPLVTHTLPGPIQQTLICGDRIVCLANKDILAVSLNGREFYKFSVYSDLYRTPECIKVWGPILAIGLKSGIVAVYHLATDVEWQNIDISKPLQMLHSGQEHIIDISIIDSGLGLSIAFSTDDNSIHLAHWLPGRAQNT